MSMDGGEQARATIDAVARGSFGKLVAFLAARTHDPASAEDAVAEAFAMALSTWPKQGCPANPEAWLMKVAQRKLIDGFRRAARWKSTADEQRLMEEVSTAPAPREIPDERLAMMFACAHPSIDAAVRAPLLLQIVLGLDATRIASAFLVSPAAMGKRLVRAKEKIRQAHIPIRVPERDELPERLDAVLNAVYGAYAEGWTDPTGADATRHDLTEEGLYLARLVADLLPNEAEPLGLLALLLHTEARRPARRNRAGEFVPLAQQDTSLWNAGLIAEAEGLLQRAGRIGAIGRFQLEAAIQSAHVHRCQAGVGNWTQVLQLYDALLALTGSTVVRLNRALAVAEVEGAKAGLAAMPDLALHAELVEYQPYWAVLAELLRRSGAREEARHANEIAIGLERDPAVRAFLEKHRSA